MLRGAIEDASDLVQRRRKAPYTRLGTWKVQNWVLCHILSWIYWFHVGPIYGYPSLGTSIDVTFNHSLVCPITFWQIRLQHPPPPRPWRHLKIHARNQLQLGGVFSYERSDSIHACKHTGSTERESVLDTSWKRKLDEQIDFDVPVGCHTHTESGPVQDDVYECNEDTTTEKGTRVKGDEPSSKVPPKKRFHESQNQIPLHNEALNDALDNIDEVSCCSIKLAL